MRNRISGVILFCLFSIYGHSQSTVESLFNEGLDLSDKGDFQGAKKKYEEGLKLNPGHAATKVEMSRTHLYMKEYDLCISLCKDILKTTGDTVAKRKTFVTWGTTLDSKDLPEEAIKIYKKGIKEFSTYYLLPYNLGVTLLRINDVDKALEQFERSASLNPDHPGSHFHLALIMEKKKNRIASMLALSRFLILEQQGARTLAALKALEAKIGSNVSKGEKNQINIILDPSGLDDKKENNFSAVDLFLSLSAAASMGEDSINKSPDEKFIRGMNALFTSLSEQEKNKEGFFWQYYTPFFVAMLKNGHAEAFCYVLLSYNGEASQQVIAWVKDNKKKTDSFFDWEYNYKWPKQ